jgi:tetratricopeptide (TPR) repeat protein
MICSGRTRSLIDREVLETEAYLAHEKVCTCDPQAREFLDDLQSRKWMTAISFFILADAYRLLGDVTKAAELCRRGLAEEPDTEDVEGWATLADDRTRLEEMLREIESEQDEYGPEAIRLRDMALGALHAGRGEEAISILRQSIPASSQSENWKRALAGLCNQRAEALLSHVVEEVLPFDDRARSIELDVHKHLSGEA